MSVFPYMFAYCTNLTTIDGMDGSLLYVYDGAFMGCTSVTSLSISGSVKVQCFFGNNDDWTDGRTVLRLDLRPDDNNHVFQQ